MLKKSVKHFVRGETEAQERTRLQKLLKAMEHPIVETQDAYIGRGDDVADVRFRPLPEAGLESIDDLLPPPERIPPMPLMPKQREASRLNIFSAVGRRKTATATATLMPVMSEESAQILINNRELPDYFPSYRGRDLVLDPLLLTERLGQFKTMVHVKGGGFMCTVFVVVFVVSLFMLFDDLINFFFLYYIFSTSRSNASCNIEST